MQLKQFNNLTTNNLNVGQVLKIPSTKLTDTYIVQKGDSLYSISKKYNTTPTILKQLNNLTTDLLSIGQILLIPSGEIIETDTTNKRTYTVKSGDTLYSIARENNTTVDELRQINNLTTNLLSVGQTLLIPTTTTTTTYIVQKGDTLYAIANKFNITVNKLKELNNLNSNNLSIGQELLISK